ncbi:MAG: LON peptidase substrate-binding domain-containing protein, partial [Planctomycetes bacterium]|nr:LON peptidase substrate-binding domain-containing protein [Planctomycetota bacterium]
MSELTKLPVLALRDMVLFPGVTAPIGVGREESVRAVKSALDREDKRILLLLQRENLEKIETENLFTIGTVARIAQVNRGPSSVQILVTGLERAEAIEFHRTEKGLEATIRPVPEAVLPDEPRTPEQDTEATALEAELRERALELAGKSGLPEPIVRQALVSVTSLGALADLVASYLDIESNDKQELIETLSVRDRVRRVLLHVERWLEIRGAREAIHERVQRELGDRQREMVLREQMKAIQDELGEGESREELEELRARIEALELTDDVAREIKRELHRLESMSPESMEAQMLRTYLETVAELPWSARSEERLDIVRAAEILDEDHYGLPEVKDRVLEHLAVLELKASRRRATEDGASANELDADSESDRRSPILLFVGPPGVGKTSIAKAIARATGREYVRVSLGGARDEADIRGHRRTYVGAMPGRIVQGLRQAGTRNPVFLLDEIDKLGLSYQGDPASALLEVLDPAQNDTFVDHYLGVPFDLSEVLFVATANFPQNIPGPLMDRMELVEFSGYTEAEKREIAKRFLLPRQIDENGLTAGQLSLPDEALSAMINGYTREAGVRQLERELGKLARKVARRIAAREYETVAVDGAMVRELLGRPRVHPERAAGQDQV